MKQTLKRVLQLFIYALEPILKFKWLLILEYTLKLWLLTLTIPLTLTIILTFFFILGGLKEYNLEFWRYYYYDGYLCDFIAWRIHLGLLFLCGIYVTNKIYE